MTAVGTPSAQDGFAEHGSYQAENQKRLREEARKKRPRQMTAADLGCVERDGRLYFAGLAITVRRMPCYPSWSERKP